MYSVRKMSRWYSRFSLNYNITDSCKLENPNHHEEIAPFREVSDFVIDLSISVYDILLCLAFLSISNYVLHVLHIFVCSHSHIYFRLWVYGAYRYFQLYFSYIVAVSFIGGGKRSTWR